MQPRTRRCSERSAPDPLCAYVRERALEHVVAAAAQALERGLGRNLGLHARKVERRVAVVPGDAHARERNHESAGNGEGRDVPIGTGRRGADDRRQFPVGDEPMTIGRISAVWTFITPVLGPCSALPLRQNPTSA
jgi:hypothetical protein